MLVRLAPVLVLLLLLVPDAQAAAPPNDNYAAAAPITLGTPISADNLSATTEADEPLPTPIVLGPDAACENPRTDPECAGTVWYEFTAPDTARYVLETCDGATDFSTVLGVYTGDTAATATLVSANSHPTSGNDPCLPGGRASRVVLDATKDTVYHVQVAGLRGGRGVFVLRAFLAPASGPTDVPSLDTFIDQNASLRMLQLVGVNFFPVGSGVRRSAAFTWNATGPVAQTGATFECSVDGAAFAACTAPVSYDTLAAGQHVFAVRAVDGATVDPTPARQIFTLGAPAPDTAFSFAPSGAGVARGVPLDTRDSIECTADGLDVPCGTSINYYCTEAHTFTATATSQAGEVDPTPATLARTGDGNACAVPTLGTVSPYGPTSDRFAGTVRIDSGGEPVTVSVEYGTTTAYGTTAQQSTYDPAGTLAAYSVEGLQPNTTYHYRLVLKSSKGTATTPDQTVTTTTPESVPEPAVTTGTPVLVGRHAAVVPITVDAKGSDGEYGIELVVPGASLPPMFFGGEYTELPQPVTFPVRLVDVDPGQDLQVRGFANDVRGNTVTLKTAPVDASPTPTPSPSPSPTPTPAPFALRKANLKVHGFGRTSRTITVDVKNLPAGTKVAMTIKLGGRTLGSVKRIANGKLVLKLSKRGRNLLRYSTARKLALVFTATPGGRVTITKTLSRRR